jgi:ribonuclease HII
LHFNDLDFLELYASKKSFFYCDEVGRGPLAGPVVSSCIKIQDASQASKAYNFLSSLGVIDSKKITSKKRKHILEILQIKTNEINVDQKYFFENSELAGLSFSLSLCTPEEIDRINILRASLLSMKKAVTTLGINSEDVCLVDGKFPLIFENEKITSLPLIKGDLQSKFIALASIIAKEFRDDLMIKYHAKFPEFGFDKHSGYPTKLHKSSIEKYGVSSIHRKSFKGVLEYVSESFERN